MSVLASRTKYKLVHGRRISQSFSLLSAIKMAVSKLYSVRNQLGTVGVWTAEEMKSGEPKSEDNQTVPI